MIFQFHKQFITNQNVILYGIFPDHVIFTETEVNLYNTKDHPFLFMSQYKEAKRLIILPIPSFHRLAEEEIGPFKVPVTAINMTARCGSTLLCQMLSKVPKVKVLAEPFSLTYLHELMNNEMITKEENERLLRSAVRILCKLDKAEQVEHIIIKLTPLNAPQCKIMHQIFDKNFELVFNTR